MGYNWKYFDTYHQIDDYRLLYPDENVIRFLVANFTKEQRGQKKILDLGCGCGQHLILLKQLGFQAYGIDASPWAIQYARKWLEKEKFKADLRIGLITQLPYLDNFFDGIIEHAVLVNNEWNDILQTCKECYRVLKPGGVGFFLLKNIKDCAFNKAKKVGKNAYLVKDSVFLSQKKTVIDSELLFHAFTREEIKLMFKKFKRVIIHNWQMSFKSLSLDEKPGERKTFYYIVLVQK